MKKILSLIILIPFIVIVGCSDGVHKDISEIIGTDDDELQSNLPEEEEIKDELGLEDEDEEASTSNSEPEAEAEREIEKKPYSGGMTREMRLSDARMIIGLFDRGYAPLKWKEKSFGLSFEEISNQLLAEVKKDITDREFYKAVSRYVAKFRDSHVSVRFPSTLKSYLNFYVDDIEGRIVVVGFVDEEAERKSSVIVGDELLSLNGRGVKEIREDLLPYIQNGNPRSSVRWATHVLTQRRESLFAEVPSGKVTAKLKSASTGEEYDVKLEWKQEGYELAELNYPGIRFLKAAMMAPAEAKKDVPNILEEARLRISPYYEEGRTYWFAYSEPFFQLGEDFALRNTEPYYTGILKVGDHDVGFIRIHTYQAENLVADLTALLEELLYFEENTDALIIDQTGNNGGNWCYSLAIASFFYSKPQKETEDMWRANRKTVTMFEQTALNSEDEEDKKIAEAIANDMREALAKGDLLTGSFPLCNMDGKIKPNKTEDGKLLAYTKPVLLLIDELAVSCGDYFPALMQDTGRATLFGATTSGGGGSVRGIENLGYSEINLRYTISLGLRENQIELPDGNSTLFIENVGVRPDIEYNITYEDFLSSYELYKDAMKQSVLDLINKY